MSRRILKCILASDGSRLDHRLTGHYSKTGYFRIDHNPTGTSVPDDAFVMIESNGASRWPRVLTLRGLHSRVLSAEDQYQIDGVLNSVSNNRHRQVSPGSQIDHGKQNSHEAFIDDTG